MWLSNEFSQVNMRTNEMSNYLNAVKQDKSNYTAQEKARIIKFISYTLSLIDEEITMAKNSAFDVSNYSDVENPMRLQTINKNMLSFAQWCEPVEQGISKSNVVESISNGGQAVAQNKAWVPPVHSGNKKVLSSEDIIARVFNVLGLLLLLAGAIAIFSMSAEFMSPAVKGILVAAIGIGMMFWGCVVTEKNKNIFSLGIMSGGLTLIYTAIGLGSFAVDLLPAVVGIFLTLIVTLLAVWLALRYNSQLITVFALIGGCLPLLQVDMLNSSVELMTIYFASLAIGGVFLVALKPWYIAAYIGLILNIIADIMLINSIELSTLPMIIVVAYILICFVCYSLLPVIRRSLSNSGRLQNYVYGLKDDIFNIITAILFSIVFIVECNVIDLDILDIILFIVAGLYYIGLSKWLDMYESKGVVSSNALFVVGLTYIPTILVTKLSAGYLGVAWAFEATAFAWRGYAGNKKFLKVISWIMLSCSCICLFVTSFESDYAVGNLLSMIAIALSYICLLIFDNYNKGDKSVSSVVASIFKVINLPIILFACFYIAHWIYENVITVNYSYEVLYNDVLSLESLCNILWLSVSALALSFVVITALKNKDKILYYASFCLGLLWSFVGLCASGITVINEYEYYSGKLSYFNISEEVVSLLSGIFYMFVFCYLLYVLFNSLCKVLNKNNRAVLLITTIYALFLISIKVANDFLLIENEDTCGIILTVIYLAIAAIWMTRGLTTSYTAMKVSGLVLAIISLLKICLFDISSVDDNLRPFIYIVSAIICLGIVRVYTYFSKKYSSVSINNNNSVSGTENYLNSENNSTNDYNNDSF